MAILDTTQLSPEDDAANGRFFIPGSVRDLSVAEQGRWATQQLAARKADELQAFDKARFDLANGDRTPAVVEVVGYFETLLEMRGRHHETLGRTLGGCALTDQQPGRFI